ncbi:cytochrome P450 [Streptomyces sp. NPDC059385]|uniref:cytochrome P450 n=1 Tax=Streptomyces sp. NPDC059385 TaxID=3346817 RepID=UPI00369FA018
MAVSPPAPQQQEVLDDLLRHQPTTRPLGQAHLVDLPMLLLVAGHETVTSMIPLAVLTLPEHPDQMDRLRTNPGRLDRAVEELLRLLSVADNILRVAGEAIEIGGVLIRAGDGVVFPTSILNRDAAVFADPDRLDWDRPDAHHLAFSHGVYQCLGQSLARAELHIALGVLLDGLPNLQLAVNPEDLLLKPAGAVQGLHRLPVRWPG